MGQDSQSSQHPQTTPQNSEFSLDAADASLTKLSREDLAALISDLKTRHKELERQNEALRESQAQLRHDLKKYCDLYEFAPLGYLTLDQAATIRAANHTAARLLGADREGLINQPFQGFVGSQDRASLTACLDRVGRSAAPGKCDLRLTTRDGHEFWARLEVVAGLGAQGEQVWLMSVTDISELQEAERQLQENQTRFAAFMEHLPGIAVIRNPQGRYLFVNQAWEQALHKPRQTWVGKTLEEIWPQGVAATLRDHDGTVLKTGKPLRTLERLPQSDGLHHWIICRFPIVDAAGQPILIGLSGIDVTEHLETKTRLEQLLSTGPAAIFTRAPEGDLPPTYVSDNVRGLVGWEAQEFLTEASFWLKHVHPEDLPRILEQIRFPWPQDRQTLEYRFQTREGSYRWMLDDVRLERDADGQPVEIIGAWMDITARKRAEEALQESETQFRRLVTQVPAVIFKGYKDWSIDFFDRKIETLSGYSKEDFDSRRIKWGDLILPEDRDKVRQIFWEALQTDQSYVREYRIRKQDGGVCWVQARGQIFLDAAGQIDHMSGVLFDITERKAAESRLQRERERFFALLDLLPAMVCLIAPDYSLPFVNRRFREFFGDPAGRRCYDLMLGRQQACEVCPSLETLRTRKPVEWEWSNRQGKTFQIFDYPFTDIDGSPLVLELGIDITERKVIEAQLLQAQKMEAVGRLAGGVAHDFNNLLMAIMGYGELMRTNLLKDDPLYQYIEDILNASERAASLTQQLLAFSRRQIIKPQVINLKQVVGDLEKMLRRLIGEHIDMKVVAARKVGPVKADPGQIGQIILNLAVNARDAMPKGGMLTIETANVDFSHPHTCHVETAPAGRYVMLAIRDTGAGMDSKTVTHIFEPFFTTKEAGKGTGLGLPMVYGIVKQNGGFIEVASQPGHGTTFQIYLPRLQGATKVIKPQATEADKLEGTETILVVEDEDPLRVLLCRFFRLYGYKVL